MFNILSYVVGRKIAESQGVADGAEVNRIALTGAIIGSPAMGAVIAKQLAQRSTAASEPAAAPADPKDRLKAMLASLQEQVQQIQRLAEDAAIEEKKVEEAIAMLEQESKKRVEAAVKDVEATHLARRAQLQAMLEAAKKSREQAAAALNDADAIAGTCTTPVKASKASHRA